MRICKVLVITVMLSMVLLPVSVMAGSEDMIKDCKVAIKQIENEGVDATDMVSFAHCQGFLKGMYYSMKQFKSENCETLICPETEGLSSNDLVYTFVKYAEDNPDSQKLDPDVLASKAFMEAFPCGLPSSNGAFSDSNTSAAEAARQLSSSGSDGAGLDSNADTDYGSDYDTDYETYEDNAW